MQYLHPHLAPSLSHSLLVVAVFDKGGGGRRGGARGRGGGEGGAYVHVHTHTCRVCMRVRAFVCVYVIETVSE
jgi:hypothetical protein